MVFGFLFLNFQVGSAWASSEQKSQPPPFFQSSIEARAVLIAVSITDLAKVISHYLRLAKQKLTSPGTHPVFSHFCSNRIRKLLAQMTVQRSITTCRSVSASK